MGLGERLYGRIFQYTFTCIRIENPVQAKYLFVAVFLGCTSTGQVGLCFLWFFVRYS